MEKIREKLENAKKYLIEKCSCEAIILFGSFARNLYKESGRNFDEEYNSFIEKIKNGDIF